MNTRIFLILLSFCIFSDLAVSQICHADDEDTAIKQKNFKVVINISAGNINVGDRIELAVKFENNSPFSVDLPYKKADRLAGYVVEITEQDSGQIEKSVNHEPNSAISSTRSWAINGISVFETKLILSDFYSLKPGNYEVFVSRPLYNTQISECIVICSERIRIIVMK